MDPTRRSPARTCIGGAALAWLLVAASAAAAEGPPDGSTPEQRAAIAADPPFVRAAPTLDAPPTRPRTKQSLFNGRDLTGWWSPAKIECWKIDNGELLL